MKILLFGANGQVGWELKDRLAPFGDVLVLTRNGIDDYKGDLSDLNGIAETIHKFQPDVVFNAAAYTAVDKAEDENDLAMRINAEAPTVMAQACKECNALLVHYSTDFVYPGTGNKPWVETDQIAPLNVYGKSKALGDEGIQNSRCRHLIFRTSWVYGLHGNNFVKTMLRLAKTHKSLNVVSDQYGAPTSASFIAQLSIAVVLNYLNGKAEEGIYHLVPNGYVNWSDFARAIFRQLQQIQGGDFVEVHDILTSEYKAKATRPLNSRMNNHKLQSVLPKGCIKDWQYYLERDLSVLIEKK